MKREKINLNTEMDMVGAANAKELKDFYIKKIQTKMRDIKDSKEFIEKSKKEIHHLENVILKVNELKKKKPKLAFWGDQENKVFANGAQRSGN